MLIAGFLKGDGRHEETESREVFEVHWGVDVHQS